MPSLYVDNTPATFRFKDGNPLSDGMASFAASILNAGPAAAQVRRQREQDSVAQAFQQAQGARADRSLDLQSLWNQQANDMNLAKSGVYAGEDPQMIDLARKVSMAGAQKSQVDQQQLDLQSQLTKAQIANMNADNARASFGQFGDGINEAVKRGVDIAKLFQGRTGTTASQPRVFKSKGEDGIERFYGLDGSGQMRELPMVQQPVVTGDTQNGGDPPATPTATPGATPGQPALRNDTAPRLEEWKAVFAQPGTPRFAASLEKLSAWGKGVDPDTGKPFPDGPRWAAQVRALLEQMAAQYDQQQQQQQQPPSYHGGD